jgi:hypothetical protein
VIEVIGAVQFAALPELGLPELVRLADALSDYELLEIGEPLAPLRELETDPVEPAPVEPAGESASWRKRGLYGGTRDERCIAQVQADRITVSKCRPGADAGEYPSSASVWRALEELCEQVSGTLVSDSAEHGPAQASVVELTHINEIRPAEGVWQSHGELHRVLRTLSPTAGNPPWAKVEHTAVELAFPLHSDGVFRGRLHVSARPSEFVQGSPTFTLELTARRLCDGLPDLPEAFAACRCDAVRAFTALTTSPMHLQWGRER